MLLVSLMLLAIFAPLSPTDENENTQNEENFELENIFDSASSTGDSSSDNISPLDHIAHDTSYLVESLSSINVEDIAMDDDGNSYVVGSFKRTATFGNHYISSATISCGGMWVILGSICYETDGFMAKLSPEGNWIWAIDFDAAPLSSVVSSSVNVYAAGIHTEDITINGNTLSISNAVSRPYVIVVDLGGNIVTAANNGCPQLYCVASISDIDLSLSLSGNQRLWIAGEFAYRVNFTNPGTDGSEYLYEPNYLNSDMTGFIMAIKYVSQGTYLNWAYAEDLEGTAVSRVSAIDATPYANSVDTNDPCYSFIGLDSMCDKVRIISDFNGPLTIGGSSFTSYSGSWDIVISKITINLYDSTDVSDYVSEEWNFNYRLGSNFNDYGGALFMYDGDIYAGLTYNDQAYFRRTSDSNGALLSSSYVAPSGSKLTDLDYYIENGQEVVVGTGTFTDNGTQDSCSYSNDNPTYTDAFVGIFNLTSNDCEWLHTSGTAEDDSANGVAVNNDPFNVVVVSTYQDGIIQMNEQTFTSNSPSSIVSSFTRDSDGDGHADSKDAFHLQPTQWSDYDLDGYGDEVNGFKGDNCPSNWGLSWRDRYGCPDMDGDGQSDLNDMFMQEDSQWNDTDGDGLGNNFDTSNANSRGDIFGWPGDDIAGATLIDPSPLDFDNDGFEDQALADASSPYDDCVVVYGTSKASAGDRYGCPDSDGDYYSDADSNWFAHPAGLADAFPGDATQWHDGDGDGYGDQINGFRYDSCSDTSGTSTMDVWGCIDTDGDGWSDGGGGANSPSDEFPFDSSQWSDRDGDGYGDNSLGTNADDCSFNYGTSDEDRLGCPDGDSDGWSDPDSSNGAHGSAPGASADSHPNDRSQWRDQDGDGYGDNASGYNADDCVGQTGTSLYSIINNNLIVNLGCIDTDNDGMEDGSDDCPSQLGTSTIDQWSCPDTDGDGYSNIGDDCTNVFGTSSLLNTFGCPDADEDGLADQDDPSPYDGAGSETDWDGDGVENDNDALPSNPTQTTDSDGDGYGDSSIIGATQVDAFPSDGTQWADYDGDGFGDRGMGNNPDSCIFEAGTSNVDRNGCADSDGDGFSDSSGSWWAHPLGMADSHPNDDTQSRDADGDGYGDNATGNQHDSCDSVYGKSKIQIISLNNIIQYYGCIDSDSDDYADASDPCPYQYGISWVDQLGCPDIDQDGISDSNDPLPQTATGNVEDWDGDGVLDHNNTPANNLDAFPNNPTQWTDKDGDGYGDNPSGTDADSDINDDTQWSDQDGDGFGDNQGGTTPDDCPNEVGTSTDKSGRGCIDSDGDGFGDTWDAFPTDSLQTVDTDGDGYGDAHSLNTNGEDLGDDCPGTFGTSWIDRYGCEDQDNDGYSNAADDCVGVPGFSTIQLTGCPDSDSDGIPDLIDPVPNDGNGSETDWDGDGYITLEDDLPLDPTQYSDIDNDGYGDNPQGNNPDAFQEDPTQWSDQDGDGFGDNAGGNNPDACPTESGNSIHIPTGLGCSDRDNDGVGDLWDVFPEEASQTADSDGDGYGDNSSADSWKSDSCIDEEGTSYRGPQGCPDSDGDGFWDDIEECPDVPGLSHIGSIGCPDSDGDGIPDLLDQYVGEHGGSASDYDGDGVLNQIDNFPTDRTQQLDSDGDGFGDNLTIGASLPDLFPNNPLAWSDSDLDGWTDQLNTEITDDCPSIPGNSSIPWRGCPDMDGDGTMDLADEDADGDGITNSLEMQAGGAEKVPYDAYNKSSKPLDFDLDGIPDSLDDDDDDDGFPDELEMERGSNPLDSENTPLNLYGEGETGFYYVPGEGFSSEYNTQGFEVSMSGVMSLVASEYLAPLLLLPISILLLLRKRVRFRGIRKRLDGLDDHRELDSMEKYIDKMIAKGKIKVEQGLLLRNQFERVKEKLENESKIPNRTSNVRGGSRESSIISSNEGGTSRGSSGGPPRRGS